MTHSLFRLSTQVFNQPQLITAESFAPIVDYLTKRNAGEISMMEDEDESDHTERKKKKVEMVGGVAFLKVEGALTYKPQQMFCSRAGTSYTGLVADVAEAIAEGAHSVVFSHSSGGGQALGCFLCADEVRTMMDEAGVKSYSYIDEGSYSASYAWACISDEVIISPEASCGSIGCICALVDDSKAMENEGYKRVVISSTPGKSPYAEDGGFSEQFLTKMQEDVTRLGNKFAGHVAKYTGLPVEDILKMDAQTFHAEKALEIGLVNAIMTPREFINHLSKKEN